MLLGVHEVCLASAQLRDSGERVLHNLIGRGNFEGGSLTWAVSDVGRLANVTCRIPGNLQDISSEQQQFLAESRRQQSYKETRTQLGNATNRRACASDNISRAPFLNRAHCRGGATAEQ